MARNMTILVDFNMLLSPLNRSTRRNISKDKRVLRKKIKELKLMYVRAFHPQKSEYPYFGVHANSPGYATFMDKYLI